MTCFYQVWCTSPWPVRTLYQVPLRGHTFLQSMMAVTTLQLLSPSTSNTSPHQMASLWTGWAGVSEQTPHQLPDCIPSLLSSLGVSAHFVKSNSSVCRNLYWADSRLKRLEVALLDGRYRKHLVKTELGHPSAVAVNPRLG